MKQQQLLIIDDEFDVREILKYNLEKEGFAVETFENPVDCREYLKSNKPSLILTDWLMPYMNGLEFCKILKQSNEYKDIPVVMITCKADEVDVVTALEIGVEDYVTKPFRSKELVARIRRILNRQSVTGGYFNYFSSSTPIGKKLTYDDVLEVQNLKVFKHKHLVTINEKQIDLTYSEFKLLELLMQNPGKVYTRSQIIENECGHNYFITERAVDVKVVGLRKKLGDSGKLIKTIRSVGYKFAAS
ncbi:MAG: response regulator [Bacteroidetes bacterium]|nr:response regulator [Bacteroidota bacterium]